MKTKLLFYLLKVFSFFLRPKVTLDGTDNTITINQPLLRILFFLGVQERNNIYIFSKPVTTGTKELEYCFCILPKEIDASQTITRQLLYNTEYKCYGFEAACPTIQSMLFTWCLPHDSILNNIPVTLHISSASIIYFSIDR